jgi:hypothetical protein
MGRDYEWVVEDDPEGGLCRVKRRKFDDDEYEESRWRRVVRDSAFGSFSCPLPPSDWHAFIQKEEEERIELEWHASLKQQREEEMQKKLAVAAERLALVRASKAIRVKGHSTASHCQSVPLELWQLVIQNLDARSLRALACSNALFRQPCRLRLRDTKQSVCSFRDKDWKSIKEAYQRQCCMDLLPTIDKPFVPANPTGWTVWMQKGKEQATALFELQDRIGNVALTNLSEVKKACDALSHMVAKQGRTFDLFDPPVGEGVLVRGAMLSTALRYCGDGSRGERRRILSRFRGMRKS